jgi:beta-carotene/zeaxanthin 4-ketolase
VQPDPRAKSLTGLLVALVIVSSWISSLAFLSCLNINQLLPLWLLPIILGRMFIQTGLFIVAHDAIHGSVVPGDHRLNRWIGQLALTLYALLSYQKLSLNHRQHHQHPGQSGDPDFHDGTHYHIFSWYLKFMKEYLNHRQKVVLFFGMSLIFFTLYWGFHVSVSNLILFWLLPIILSSMQLFLFGTYLPHRSGSAEPSHHAISSNYPLIWSFLSCYHFGYHWEHHEYPLLPWYRLPSVRQPKPHRQRALKSIMGSVLATLN